VYKGAFTLTKKVLADLSLLEKDNAEGDTVADVQVSVAVNDTIADVALLSVHVTVPENSTVPRDPGETSAVCVGWSNAIVAMGRTVAASVSSGILIVGKIITLNKTAIIIPSFKNLNFLFIICTFFKFSPDLQYTSFYRPNLVKAYLIYIFFPFILEGCYNYDYDFLFINRHLYIYYHNI
jgi:hypothetical protein